MIDIKVIECLIERKYSFPRFLNLISSQTSCSTMNVKSKKSLGQALSNNGIRANRWKFMRQNIIEQQRMVRWYMRRD